MKYWLVAQSFSSQSRVISTWFTASRSLPIQNTVKRVRKTMSNRDHLKTRMRLAPFFRPLTHPRSSKICWAQQAIWTTRAPSAINCSWSPPICKIRSATALRRRNLSWDCVWTTWARILSAIWLKQISLHQSCQTTRLTRIWCAQRANSS